MLQAIVNGTDRSEKTQQAGCSQDNMPAHTFGQSLLNYPHFDSCMAGLIVCLGVIYPNSTTAVMLQLQIIFHPVTTPHVWVKVV